MKAGRMLDALVAEKVFRWTWQLTTMVGATDEKVWMLVPPGDDWINYMPVQYKFEMLTPTRIVPDGLLPHYSTDIAAAMAVLEMFAWYSIVKHDNGGYQVQVINCATAVAPTLPVAICPAALRAYGVDVDSCAEGRAYEGGNDDD